MSNEYEGGHCQQMFVDSQHYVGIQEAKPNHNLKFFNSDGDEVGALNFDGPGLEFEGIANESAIVFITFVAEQFAARLKDERNKARQECIDLYSSDDLAKDWADKINQRMEK